MGWAFEYLGEILHDSVMNNLQVYYKDILPQKFDIEFDDTTQHLIEYGDGYPQCNKYKGKVIITDGGFENEILALDIEYVIRRHIPDRLHYGDYENTYDIYLTKLGDFKIKPPEKYEAEELYLICKKRIEKSLELIEQWNENILTITDHQVIVKLWDILTGKERSRDGKFKTRIKSGKN